MRRWLDGVRDWLLRFLGIRNELYYINGGSFSFSGACQGANRGMIEGGITGLISGTAAGACAGGFGW